MMQITSAVPAASNVRAAVWQKLKSSYAKAKGADMPSAPCKFRATEVTRAVKALRKAGVEVARVNIMPDGTISIVPTNTAMESDDTAERIRNATRAATN
jgi:hypothetical protein